MIRDTDQVLAAIAATFLLAGAFLSALAHLH